METHDFREKTLEILEKYSFSRHAVEKEMKILGILETRGLVGIYRDNGKGFTAKTTWLGRSVLENYTENNEKNKIKS